VGSTVLLIFLFKGGVSEGLGRVRWRDTLFGTREMVAKEDVREEGLRWNCYFCMLQEGLRDLEAGARYAL
jgi:hypothetical protein